MNGSERTLDAGYGNGNEAIRAVNSDVQEAKRLGLTGTPTFFINGVKYEGALALNAWKTIIDFELRQGTAR